MENWWIPIGRSTVVYQNRGIRLSDLNDFTGQVFIDYENWPGTWTYTDKEPSISES